MGAEAVVRGDSQFWGNAVAGVVLGLVVVGVVWLFVHSRRRGDWVRLPRWCRGDGLVFAPVERVVVPVGVGVVVRCWRDAGVCWDVVDPGGDEVAGIVGRLRGGGVQGVTVFARGVVLDVAVLQVTENGISIPSATAEGSPGFSGEYFSSDGVVVGVQVREARSRWWLGRSGMWFASSVASSKYDARRTIRVRSLGWQHIRFPVDLAVSVDQSVRAVEVLASGGDVFGALHWVKPRFSRIPVPPTQLYAPDPLP